MVDTANDKLLSSAIRNAVEVDRFSEAQVREIMVYLNQHVYPDIRDSIERGLANVAGTHTPYGLARNARLRTMQEDITQISRSGYSSLYKDTASDFDEFARLQSLITTDSVRAALPSVINVTLNNITPAQASAIIRSTPFEGKILSSWYSDLSNSMQRNITQQLNIGLIQGESIQQLTRRISGKGGVFDLSRRNTEAVVRTSTNHVSTQTREQTFAENSDIVDKIQWVSTLDNRTTPICQSLDGTVYEIGVGPRPPAHFRCRSTITPVLKSFERFGLKDPSPSTRASMDGQVSEKLNYEQWLKKQDIKIQNDALGKRKGELFRQGKVGVKDLVNNRGRPLTLKELAKKNNIKPAAPKKPSPPPGRIKGRTPTSVKGLERRLRDIDARLNTSPNNADLLKQREATQLSLNKANKPLVKPNVKKHTQMTGAELRAEASKRLAKLNTPDVSAIIKQVEDLGDELKKLNKNYNKGRASNSLSYGQYSEQFKVIADKRNGLIKLAKKLDEQTTKVVHDLLLESGRSSIGLNITGSGRTLSKAASKIKQANDFFDNLITDPNIRGTSVDINFNISRKRRAYAYSDLGEVFISHTRATRSYVHEVSHILEYKVPGWQAKIKAFYARRTKGEVLEKLRSLVPDSNHKWDEVTYKDDFLTPYIGKYYAHGSTEILSMGLELMYIDPAKLLQQDPDMFDFIYDLVKGL